MKNIIIASIVAGTVGFIASTGAVKAGLWTKLSGMFAETVPSKLYAIEAQGFNIRGYIYQLESVGKTCNFNATDGGSGGLFCWDTKKETK